MIFAWKPFKSDKAFTYAEAYLIEQGNVFPVSTVADVSAYANGMPLNNFKAKVKAAIAKNVDVN